MLDPKNKDVAVGISSISCLGAEKHEIKVYRPPSWNFPLPVWSHSLLMSLIGKLDLKNISIAVGISLISCLGTEKFGGHHLGFFHFQINCTVFLSIPLESWTQNLGNAVGISLISRLWAEIQHLSSWFFFKFYNFRFCGRHIGILDDDGKARIVPSYSSDIFRKSHIEYLSTTCGSEMAAKRSAWW